MLATGFAFAAGQVLAQPDPVAPQPLAPVGKEPAPASGGSRIAEPKRLSLPPTPALPPSAKAGMATLNGTRLFFAEVGSGDPVLFLHGGMGSSNHWGHQVAALGETHRVIVMDTRGHGRSPVMAKRFGFSLFAKDVEGLLDHLGLTSAAIVGWSDGGITGLQLAMTQPRRVSRLFAFGANVTPDGLIAGGARTPTFTTYASRCRAEYATLSPSPERWPDLMAGLGAMWRSEPNFSRRNLETIGVPTMIASAQHDEIIRPEHAARIAAAIPGAKLLPLKGVSHFAMLQDRDGFTAALRGFLAG